MHLASFDIRILVNQQPRESFGILEALFSGEDECEEVVSRCSSGPLF